MLNLVKKLVCGHDRTDAAPAKPGELAHCRWCPGLRDIVKVELAPGSKVTNYDRDLLAGAGFKPAEIRKLEGAR